MDNKVKLLFFPHKECQQVESYNSQEIIPFKRMFEKFKVKTKKIITWQTNDRYTDYSNNN